MSSTALRATTDGDDHAPSDPSPGTTLSAFASPRRSIWGSGTALVIEIPAPWTDHLDVVIDALGVIGGQGNPIAFGALPYDRSGPARFVVPRVTHTQTADGDRWTTRVEGGSSTQRPDDELTNHGGEVALPLGPPAPSDVRVRSMLAPQEWCDAVTEARSRIRAGELTKVVLAREIEVVADVEFDPATLWNRLREMNPGALCFCVDKFVGASPELLVSRMGSTVRAQPMAGTTRRTGHAELDQRRAGELLGSQKNRVEHQITIDAVHDGLLGWCSYLDAEPSPSVVGAGPVQHLATLVEGHLSSPEPSVLELVSALHPTPAVGGSPTATALELQGELEGADRGRYAGPVGWVDRDGNGAFAVGIRSVQLEGRTARLFAGVGVVADSDPAAELAETRAKAQALLSTLVRI